MTDNCVHGAKNEGRIKALEDRAEKNDTDHASFVQTISDIRDRLLGRPTWAVLVIISFLSSVCVGLITLTLKG